MPKTPDKLERRQPSVDFNLQEMGQIYEQTNGQADVPHRHDYYTVLLVKKAVGKHIVDYQAYDFRALEVHFVSPGQVHQVALADKPSGWVFTFSRSFLAENNIAESFITNINLFRVFGESPPLSIDANTFDRLLFLVKEMKACLPIKFNYRTRALGALLQLFLIYCNNSPTLNVTQLDEENTSVCMFRNFKNLVENNYNAWHKVNEYASKIPISAKHLSQTVKNLTGKSAKEIIQDRLLLEAKRLLLHTDLNVKEVGYHIGFEEPLHFSSFFKKRAGMSPTKFRTDHLQ